MLNRTVVVVFMIAISLAGPALAETSCIQPKLDSFLENARSVIKFKDDYFPSLQAKYLSFKASGRDLRWLGASWEGPLSGAIFVIDCAGKRIAAERLGYIKSLRAGPSLSDIPTFEIVYVSSTGTGLEDDYVQLVQFNNGSIKELWSHAAYEFADIPGVLSSKIFYSWDYSADGRSIRVITRSSSRKETVENFCWNGIKQRYLACRAPAPNLGK